MKIGITKLIAENIAPPNVGCLAIYDGDTKICEIPLDRMRLPSDIGAKLYSFGVISDLHLFPMTAVAWTPETKFDNALTFFEEQGCAFCVANGDLTQSGFYLRTDDSDPTTQSLDERQFAKYKEICDKHTIPVYELMGNHESYYGMAISNNLALMQTYTGNTALSYTKTYGNDVFIFCGQDHGSSVMSDADFTWLGNTLETYKDNRKFLFFHSHIDDNVEGGVEDSGNPCYARENSIFGYWGATKTQNFINLMKQYSNTLSFHGHTHIMFEAQTFEKEANYSTENGFKSAHIPSSGNPRKLISSDGTWQAQESESQGYIVDVYENHVVLKGYDLINKSPVPIAQYCIAV